MNFKELMPVYKDGSKNNYIYKFTVFTPVFNCENSIEKVHESLVNQTFKDFEWLIINDASTDRSHEVISEIIQNSPLTINYINNKENKHKMSCFIQSIELAQGEFLLPFDGDDECMSQALEVFNNEYESTPEKLKSKVGAVTVNCIDQYGKLVGELFPKSPFYSDTFDAFLSKQIVGEKWGFTKTDILRSINVNPEMLKFGFIPESIIWNTVARSGFLTKCVNENLRIYNIGVEGSIMNSPMTSRTAFGSVLNRLSEFNWFFKTYVFKSPIYFLKSLYIIIFSTNFLDYSLKTYVRSIDSYVIKFAFIGLWPFRKLMK